MSQFFHDYIDRAVKAQEVLIYGEGGLALTSPSIEPEGRDPWRWLTSPCDNPPQAPKPAVWQFLREQNAPAVSRVQEMPDWEEIYHSYLLRSFLCSKRNSPFPCGSGNSPHKLIVVNLNINLPSQYWHDLCTRNSTISYANGCKGRCNPKRQWKLRIKP